MLDGMDVEEIIFAFKADVWYKGSIQRRYQLFQMPCAEMRMGGHTLEIIGTKFVCETST